MPVVRRSSRRRKTFRKTPKKTWLRMVADPPIPEHSGSPFWEVAGASICPVRQRLQTLDPAHGACSCSPKGEWHGMFVTDTEAEGLRALRFMRGMSDLEGLNYDKFILLPPDPAKLKLREKEAEKRRSAVGAQAVWASGRKTRSGRRRRR